MISLIQQLQAASSRREAAATVPDDWENDDEDDDAADLEEINRKLWESAYANSASKLLLVWVLTI